MTNPKLYRRDDLDWSSMIDVAPAAVQGVVNVGNSETIGGGIGKFEAGFELDWTVTYDEMIFVHEGIFIVEIDGQRYEGHPGDTLWLPKGTPLKYIAEEDVTFFYAVYPVTESPSTNTARDFPAYPPQKA